ncbi:MAG: YcgL domain-containing protein [Porticoccaceae bacterium]|jgi:uncharacterized protein|nr:YcgL domain-containing protein [Porticoccaceae bacterium]
MTDRTSENLTGGRILCDIYKGNKKEEMYLYVAKPEGLDRVPETLIASFGELAPVTTLVLTESRKLARADIHKVMAELQEKGFYLQMPPAKYPVSDQPPSSINKYG